MKNKEMLWNKEGVEVHPKIKVMGQVYIYDYKNLENAEGQRPLNAMGLKQLGDSIESFGICSCPIAVKKNKKYIIVDGWHRVHIAKKHKLPIVCTLVNPSCTINELMIILNTTQLNWQPEAFLNNGIVHHKNPDYVFLRKVYEDVGISLIALYHIFSYDIRNMTETKRRFEKGIWEATTKDLGNKVIRYAEEINKYVPFSCNANFIRGFVKCVSNEGFDQKHLMTQLKRLPNHIHDGDKPLQHAKMINDIYNHLALKEEKVYLI